LLRTNLTGKANAPNSRCHTLAIMQTTNTQTTDKKPYRRLAVGGSNAAEAAVENRTGQFGLFKPSVEVIRGGDHLAACAVRIMPAHNPSLLPEDKSWAGSVAPYRKTEGGILDAATQTPAFSSWFSVIMSYSFLGRSSESLVSPMTLAAMGGASAGFSPMDMADPIHDMRTAAKNSANPMWMALTEAPQPAPGQQKDKNARAVIPYQRSLAVMNLMVYDGSKQTLTQGLYTMSLTGLENTKAEISWLLPNGYTPRDPNWTMFQLGDVTCPQYGTFGRVVKKSAAGNAQVKAVTISFADRQGANLFCPNFFQLTPEILAKRYDLLDCEKVIHIPSYQDIVEWAVKDGAFPYELIQYACGSKCDVPKQVASFGAAATGFYGQQGGYNGPAQGAYPGMPQMGAVGGMPGMMGGGMPQMGGYPGMMGGGMPMMPGAPQMGGFPGAAAQPEEEEDPHMETAPNVGGGWSNPPTEQPAPAGVLGSLPQMGAVGGLPGGLPNMGGMGGMLAGISGGTFAAGGPPVFNPPSLPGSVQQAPPPPPPAPVAQSPTAATDGLAFYVFLPGAQAAEAGTVLGQNLSSLPAGAQVSCVQPNVTNGWVAPATLGYQTVQAPPPPPPVMSAAPAPAEVAVQQSAPVAPAVPSLMHSPSPGGNAVDGPLTQDELEWCNDISAQIEGGKVTDSATIGKWSMLRLRGEASGQIKKA